MRQGEKVRVEGGRGETATLGLWDEIPCSAPIGESSEEDEGRLIQNGRRMLGQGASSLARCVSSGASGFALSAKAT